MSGLQALQSVQFVTVKGKRMAVLNVEDWEALIEWLEDIEDRQIIRDAYARLDAAGGDPECAGWLDWDALRDELE